MFVRVLNGIVVLFVFLFLISPNLFASVADLHLKLPFPAGETWHTSCAYNGTGPCKTHATYTASGRLNKDHYALDFNYGQKDDDLGKSIRAAASGRAEIHYGNRGYGNYVLLHHGNGYVTRYAHLQSISVEQNQWVLQGQEVGKCGKTGNSSSPHLHFALYHNGQATKPEPMGGYSDFSSPGSYYTSANGDPVFRTVAYESDEFKGALVLVREDGQLPQEDCQNIAQTIFYRQWRENGHWSNAMEVVSLDEDGGAYETCLEASYGGFDDVNLEDIIDGFNLKAGGHGGSWQTNPGESEGTYDNDPFVPNADVSIRYLRIKGPGQSHYHTESGAVFSPGQTQEIRLEGKIKNESNDNADLARIQYCATTKKKFRHDERIWIDEDYLDHQEREHDFDPGETITKHGQAFITLASDLSSITVFKGDRSHTFPITEKHLYEKKIPVYFWIDTKIEVGNDEDYDVSCSVGSHCGDEYAKFEVLLPWFNSSFNLSTIGGEAPLQVNFTNTSQTGNGATISYHWDFGDGETSNEENPVHIYNQAGTYTVSLTTTSNWGESRTSQATVTVTEPPIDGIVDTNYGSTDPNNPKELTDNISQGYCLFGTASSLSGDGTINNPWQWTCQGENGGTDEIGYAYLRNSTLNKGNLTGVIYLLLLSDD